MLYTEKTDGRNEVKVVLDEMMKTKIVEAIRNSDRIIAVKLIRTR